MSDNNKNAHSAPQSVTTPPSPPGEGGRGGEAAEGPVSDLIEVLNLTTPRIIKVIGVGGGGGNAVAQMYRDNIPEVRCLVANTDRKALEDNVVPEHLQMGPGLGAGGRPEQGRALAEASLEEIDHALDDETKMVFITAGMGGGTGTGASPIIARQARSKGILTIGIVTIPFAFEGRKQIDKALDGMERLAEEVDAMLVINNERLREIYSDVSVVNAFALADRTLSNAVGSITEIISMHGRIDLDFEDVRTTLTNGGVAVMSSGYGKGEGRVTKALHDAINSPLLNNKDIYNATHILLSITTSDEDGKSLLTSELDEVTSFMERFNDDIVTKWGFSLDRSLGDTIKITIVASGFKLYAEERTHHADGRPLDRVDDDPAAIERRSRFYDDSLGRVKRRPQVFLFSADDLRREDVLHLVEDQPTYTRTRAALDAIRRLAEGEEG